MPARPKKPKKLDLRKTPVKKPTPPPSLPEPQPEDMIQLPEIKHVSRSRKILYILGSIVLFVIVGLAVLRVSYRSRILPGGTGNGINLTGLSRADALKLLNDQSSKYLDNNSLTVVSDKGSWQIDVNQIDLGYDNARTVDEVYARGRQGNWIYQAYTDMGLLVTSAPNVSYVSYDGNKLYPYLSPISVELNQPVSNASYTLSGSDLNVSGGQSGQRFDLGQFLTTFGEAVGQMSRKQITITPVTIDPAASTNLLEDHMALAKSYTQSPLTLTEGSRSWPVDQATILSWLRVNSLGSPLQMARLDRWYDYNTSDISLDIDTNLVESTLTDIGKQIDQSAQDAQLTISGGKATVFAQSQDGKKLVVDQSADKIITTVKDSSQPREIALVVDTQKAAVSSDTIGQLGITDLLSEGVTYFPNSPHYRINNITVGARQFNGVLIKPGDVFSFGAQMGDVGPAQGYLPGLVILEGKLGDEYGSGMCQVSTTAFRAALQAGLPIIERHNHSFAVSYYTAPYGVPGVDATIYYPGVDFKFKNDTGAYILIQTEIKGTELHFRFYGTKKKSGVIHAPVFISGSNDATKPSHTVFTRDILDLSGKVTKTDTFNTYYKSSLDFPAVN